VLASVGDFRALVSANDNAAATRMELAKHVKEIGRSPGDGDEIKYTGKWDLLGAAAIWMVPRAGIAPNCLLRCGL
jgi:hypothetical protein